jgi:hypothetical protein
MDEETRQMIAEAVAFDNEVRAQSEQRECEEQQRYVERSAPDGLLYRTTVTPRPAVEPSIDDRLDALVGVIGEEVGIEHKKLYAEITALRERIIALEAANKVLQGFITGGKAKMLSIKGGKADVA